MTLQETRSQMSISTIRSNIVLIDKSLVDRPQVRSFKSYISGTESQDTLRASGDEAKIRVIDETILKS